MRKGVFWPPFILLSACVLLSMFNDVVFEATIRSAFNWVNINLGWLYALSVFIFLAICVFILLSPASRIRFGGADARPEFSTWNWFAMSLCSGIGIGIVFWGIAEPIHHLASPPESLAIEAFSAQAALFAISTAFLHWTFTPYALYVICAIPIGLAFYNHNQPLAISSGLFFLFGKKPNKQIGDMVDALCLFSVAGGVSVSFGQGLMQVGSGLNAVFGITPGPTVWGLCAIFIILSYTVSSYSGINKGIRILSDYNLKVFIAIMVFVFFVGPTVFILNLGVQGLGTYIDTFVSKSLWLGAVTEDQWPRWWSLFYWASWIASAPIFGLFLARLCRGRTVRQFILVNLVAPAVFGMIWFSIFGGAAIDMQLRNIFNLWGSIEINGLESAAFTFFHHFFLGSILVPVFLVIIILSFVTGADSVITSLAAISTKDLRADAREAPGKLKILWGVITGSMAFIMISMGGINGTKMLGVLTSLPIIFLLWALAVSGIKGLSESARLE